METSGPVTVDPAPPDPAPLGRRERKKQATRKALQDAALRLSLERGPDNVTVEDICAEADVAPRTFFNHFAGKDDALAGDGPPRPTAEQVARLSDGPPERLWDDIADLMVARVPDVVARKHEMRQRRQLMEQHPVLIAKYLSHFQAMERTMAEAIAVRTGADPDTDAYPQLVAGVAAVAMRVAIRRWTASGETTSLEANIRESIDLLRRGL